MTEDSLGIVGLGRRGGNMATNLLEAGEALFGFDVSESARADFRDTSGQVC